jgi:branched-chain amino acid transport system substrate-binding protein
MSLNRRAILKGALAGTAASAVKVPAAVAQPGPIKVGFLTVKSGALASGGLQMEQGLVTFFKDRGNKMAGRAVELYTQDTAGNPAQARTKTQELVERLNVHCIIGPLAAFEALAIDDYIRSSKTPILTVAGAEDMTQRKANPWLVRPSCTSAQSSYPVADYAAKELKYKRVATIGDDFAFGHECVAGFHKVFEDLGGKVVQKLWTPLNAPDYGTYLSQFKPDLDAIFTAHAGRGQGCAEQGAARRQGARHAARPLELRPVRQRGRQHLHPQGREEGWQVCQRHHQDLSECQPVLDLSAGGVPEGAGVLARLSAGEESGVIAL